MNLLSGYNSDPDQDKQQLQTKRPKLELAPYANTEDYTTTEFIPSETTKELSFNVPYDLMQKPTPGPLNPFTRLSSSAKTVHSGYVEHYDMNEYTFNNLERTYQTYKYTIAPDSSTGEIIGDKTKASQMSGQLVSEIPKSEIVSTKIRKPQGDVADITTWKGPWAGFEGEFEFDTGDAPTDQQISEAEAHRKTQFVNSKIEEAEERTIFHGSHVHDYLGRTFIHPPNDIDIDLNGEPGNQICYVPKQCIHTWTGHTKGVNAIRFFPKTAHLILSASMDHKVKIWDVYHERQCQRTYLGHSKAVRDISFNWDGTKFLSASYDKYVKLWDTETGQCITKFTMRAIPQCVKFFPEERKGNLFLAGMSNKKILQFDINTGKVNCEYDQHLGPINSITFYDDNKRFISTSDDKTVRAWEFGVPVVIKYISDPNMHSVPATTLSPSKNWIAGQSLDNQILSFNARDKLRINRLKSYRGASKSIFLRGHLVAGYACDLAYSPDEKYLVSGDSSGKLFFWDTKSCKTVSKLNAHETVVMSVLWHPHETSKVASCSWDGTIKSFFVFRFI